MKTRPPVLKTIAKLYEGRDVGGTGQGARDGFLRWKRSCAAFLKASIIGTLATQILLVLKSSGRCRPRRESPSARFTCHVTVMTYRLTFLPVSQTLMRRWRNASHPRSGRRLSLADCGLQRIAQFGDLRQQLLKPLAAQRQ